MNLVNFHTNIPEENIAMDEILLIKAENGEIGETLRFWTSNYYFVVVGRAGKISEECYSDRCLQDGIKVIRRISGGGTVLQGPGCYNYSLILSYNSDEQYRNISSAYRTILGKIAESLNQVGIKAELFPESDLAIDKRKISGNAQARKRKYFLHHGTFLFDFDIDKVAKYLTYPPKEPGYRKGRSHDEFIQNVPVTSEVFKGAIKEAFLPKGGEVWKPGKDDLEVLRDLVDGKYGNSGWNDAV